MKPVPVNSPARAQSDAAIPVEEEAAPVGSGNMFKDLLVSMATQSWLASMVFHLVLMLVLALVMGTITVVETIGNAPFFESVEEIEEPIDEVEHFEVGYTPLDPSELSTESLTLEAPAVEA